MLSQLGKIRGFAFICHFSGSLLLLFFAAMYLIKSEFMPYHEVAVGMPWEDLPKNIQLLILVLMKTSGAGWLATSFSINLLLFKKFRKGPSWADWAIPCVGLISSLSGFIVTFYVASHTPANPPYITAAVGSILFTAGYLLSIKKLSTI